MRGNDIDILISSETKTITFEQCRSEFHLFSILKDRQQKYYQSSNYVGKSRKVFLQIWFNIPRYGFAQMKQIENSSLRDT